MKVLVTVGAVAVLAAASVAAAAAPAKVPVGPRHVLHTKAFVEDPSHPRRRAVRAPKLDAAWVNGVLRAHLPHSTKTRGTYVVVDSRAARAVREPVRKVKNLSFDWYLGSASSTKHWRTPLLVSPTGQGLLMNGVSCAHPIGHGWMRADFTGFTRNCSMTFFNRHGIAAFDAGHGMTAWQDFVHTHPHLMFHVSRLFFDRGGDWAADNISLGTGYMYTTSDASARPCLGQESRC